MNYGKTLAAIALAALSVSAQAADVSWNYAELNVNRMTVDDIDDVTFNGLGLDFSRAVNETYFIAGEATKLTDSYMGVDLSYHDVNFNVGGRFNVAAGTDAYVMAGFGSTGVEADLENGTATYFQLQTGVRSMVADNLEAGAYVAYQRARHIGESDTILGVEGRFFVTPKVSFSLQLEGTSDYKKTAVGVAYHF